MTNELPEPIRKKLADFQAQLPEVRYFEPEGKPKKEWKIFYGDTLGAAWEVAMGAVGAATTTWNVAGDAAGMAMDEACGAVGDTAMEAAWRVARAAERDVNGAIGRDATWDGAWDAAYGAEESIASAAVRDATLYAELIVVSDLDFKDKAEHEAHARARWEVWQKGYGLVCDVDGVLYVYAAKPKAKVIT